MPNFDPEACCTGLQQELQFAVGGLLVLLEDDAEAVLRRFHLLVGLQHAADIADGAVGPT